MTIELTPAQQDAKDAAVAQYKDGGVFLLSGLAGTGKTTTLVEIVRAIKESGSRVAVAAPTGKAAHVINSKQDVFTARTLHSVLTRNPFDSQDPILSRLRAIDEMAQSGPLPPEVAEEEQTLLKKLDGIKKSGKETMFFGPIEEEAFFEEYDGLVVDEASMVGAKFQREFMNHIRCPVIYSGDRAQLPPVDDEPAVDLANADARLEQILRQKDGSGILEVAGLYANPRTQAPTKRFISQFNDVEAVAMSNTKAAKGYETSHQFIVWKNKERHMFNEVIRVAKGLYSPLKEWPHLPAKGEKLMIDENVYTINVTKGQIVTVDELLTFDHVRNPYLAKMSVIDERGNKRVLWFSLADLVGERQLLGTKYDDDRCKFLSYKVGIRVMFSHSITAHKAQGSEFDNVFVMCTMDQNKPDFKRWMYTAVTRAKQHLVLADYRFSHG